MPVAEIAGEAILNAGRFIARIVLEIFADFLIERTGYRVLKILRPASEPTWGAAMATGILVWLALIAAGFAIWTA